MSKVVSNYATFLLKSRKIAGSTANVPPAFLLQTSFCDKTAHFCILGMIAPYCDRLRSRQEQFVFRSGYGHIEKSAFLFNITS